MSGSLTHPVCEIVQYALIGQGLGTTPPASSGWPVYSHEEPDAPDSCITVYNTQGRLDGHFMADGSAGEHHGVMIRVRAALPETAGAKARAIAVALDTDVYNDAVSIDSSVYVVHAITRTGDVMPANIPGEDRKAFTINAVVDLRQTT